MLMSNFEYLKNIDKNLYEIITDGEKLYRSEFFEQCMGQTRRFGEHICRNVLGGKRTVEITFDEMLSTLSDKINGFEQEKEFIDDLYFLKKNGNISVHSQKVEHCGTLALECLQRAFEVGLNYAVYHKKASPDILKLRYDVELLITGKPGKKTLKEKYIEAIDEINTNSKPKTLKTSKKSLENNKKKVKNKEKPQVTQMKSVPPKTGLSKYWLVVIFFSLVTFITIIYLLL